MAIGIISIIPVSLNSKLSLLSGFVILASIIIFLFIVKTKVLQFERELLRINTEIKREKAVIHVLEAELTLFETPSRIQKLADKYLNLKPIKNKQIIINQ